jgi:phosphate transport system substrate-binding protein
MHSLILSGFLALAAPLAFAADSADDPTRTPLLIGGTGGALSVVSALAEAYRARHSGPPIEVLNSLGTGGGLRALADGRIDIALASRPLTEAERQGNVVRVFARTPLVFVANADVSADGLDTDTLIAIYRGERTSWPDGRRCRPILRPWGDAESAVLAESNPAVAEALKYALRHRGLLAPLTTQETLEAIHETPGAFGYSPLAEVLAHRGGLRVLSYNQIVPSPTAVANGEYPLAVKLSMVTTVSPRADVRGFIDFVTSSDGAAILADQGCLPAAS